MWRWRYVAGINSVIYKREKKLKRKNFLKTLNVVDLGCGVHPCEEGCVSVLWCFPGRGSLCLCSGWWNWLLSLWRAVQCPVVGFGVSLGSVCLWSVFWLGQCSVQFSRSVMFDPLRPHESQHARRPCPSPTPGVTQTHVHWVGDAIQPSHPLLSPFPPAPSPSQHQSLFQWVSSLHEVAKVLEFQL